jgi:hypothetical protein
MALQVSLYFLEVLMAPSSFLNFDPIPFVFIIRSLWCELSIKAGYSFHQHSGK